MHRRLRVQLLSEEPWLRHLRILRLPPLRREIGQFEHLNGPQIPRNGELLMHPFLAVPSPHRLRRKLLHRNDRRRNPLTSHELITYTDYMSLWTNLNSPPPPNRTTLRGAIFSYAATLNH